MKSVFWQTLVLNRLTSQILKPALILAKTLTSDPYNGRLLKRRRSVLLQRAKANPTVNIALIASWSDLFWELLQAAFCDRTTPTYKKYCLAAPANAFPLNASNLCSEPVSASWKMITLILTNKGQSKSAKLVLTLICTGILTSFGP